ncbi:CCA tRNA nucleotidyltransferase [Phreatobacter sp.]|uniref:CCA tRNA nucleotidyltransferase n=1 Tax=Phreatobacter sp. TaxID=1966341 RepID=UPI0022CBE818|nr:CCA tRNA nucleotidyltransferase [Phreatobacter sp.]MCZ8316442.1 CCA tRNA nucleotidyltransferase [Phreatobacter sp.]
MSEAPLPPLPAWFADGPVRRLIDVIGIEGDEARPVGGAVRNWLIGSSSGDVDIATTALPAVVAARCGKAGFKVVPTGIDHGTVTVVVDGTGFEVTTLREDVATDGRRAVVRFGHDWLKDAARRDFTFNAMSLTAEGALFDPFGGREDLARGRVRFIGEAIARVREDRLRILRLFRFHATYGAGALDAEARAAAIAERAGVADLSRERVRAELMKLLVAPRAGAGAQAMADCGLLDRILGGVPMAASVQRLSAIEAATGLPADPVRRMGALAVLTCEDAVRLRDRLALSNAEFRRLEGIGHGWRQADPAAGPIAAKALLAATGPRGYGDRAMVGFARSGAPADDAAWLQLLTLPERWKAPSLPVSGDDLMRRGLPAGPPVGRVLASVRERWIAADFPMDRASVEAITAAALAEERG